MSAAVAAVAEVPAVAEIPATETSAAIPAVAAVAAVAAIPATGAELEADRVAEALTVAAAAKAAANQPPPISEAITGTPVSKPEGVPDKFWDAKQGVVNFEAWSKAHLELETKFHAPTKTPEVIAAEKVIADAKATGTPPAVPTAQAAVVTEARAEFAEKGELSAETFTKLAAQGLDQATVESYISGVAAQSTKLQATAHEAANGSENYEKMLEWAKEGIDVGEQKTFNALIASNDEAIIKTAVTELFKKYGENVNVEGQRIGGTGAGSGANTFASKAEMTAAMNAPSTTPGKTRYEIDPAYRVECQNKIKASRKAGINIFS